MFYTIGVDDVYALVTELVLQSQEYQNNTISFINGYNAYGLFNCNPQISPSH